MRSRVAAASMIEIPEQALPDNAAARHAYVIGPQFSSHWLFYVRDDSGFSANVHEHAYAALWAYAR